MSRRSADVTAGATQALPRPPSVDTLARSDLARELILRYGRAATIDAIRRTVDQCRTVLRSGFPINTSEQALLHATARSLEEAETPSLRRVINLTGTVLHTNLGRAVLAEEAIKAAADAMRSAVALEFDLGDGVRSERDDHVRGLLRELTGAEDACIVNNNAAAVLLVVNTFASGKEAVVSRGELVEIGGAFRLPDIMARAGARLIEIGTTNRTHLRDFEGAVTADTGMILKAHTSNYLIQGFTKTVAATEIAAVARERNVPFVHDLGSGALVDLGRYGLKSEPTVREALAEGADLVTFSGDKLLGGPQVGIIAGRKSLVARVAKNPIKRTIRVDKIRLAALEATLRLYRDPDRLPQRLPTLRYFTRTRDEIEIAALRLLSAFDSLSPTYAASVVPCTSQIGSGALPLDTLASAGIAMRAGLRKGEGAAIETLSRTMRKLPVPIVGRIRGNALILDLRCLDDEALFLAQIARLPEILGKARS